MDVMHLKVGESIRVVLLHVPEVWDGAAHLPSQLGARLAVGYFTPPDHNLLAQILQHVGLLGIHDRHEAQLVSRLQALLIAAEGEAERGAL